VAQEQHKTVVLDCIGMQLVPPRYQATIKNVAIQLIRNAVMHGVEPPAVRTGGGKPAHGTLRLEFKALPARARAALPRRRLRSRSEKVRATALAKGLITAEPRRACAIVRSSS